MKRWITIIAALLLGLGSFLVDFDRFSQTAIFVTRSDTGRSIICDGAKPERFYVELKRFFDDIKKGSQFQVSIVPRDPSRRSWTFDVEVLPQNEVSIVTGGAPDEIDRGRSKGSSSLGSADYLTNHVWLKVCYEYVDSDQNSNTGSKSQPPPIVHCAGGDQ